jgi:hypothetical protein
MLFDKIINSKIRVVEYPSSDAFHGEITVDMNPKLRVAQLNRATRRTLKP